MTNSNKMFHTTKTFEQTLRTKSVPPPPSQLPPVTATALDQTCAASLKPELHKGCTGKAHAGGTIKTKLPSNYLIIPENNADKVMQRKNSIGSEIISDNDSEFDPACLPVTTSAKVFKTSLNQIKLFTTNGIVDIKNIEQSVVDGDISKVNKQRKIDKNVVESKKTASAFIQKTQANKSQKLPNVRVVKSQSSISPVIADIKPPWISGVFRPGSTTPRDHQPFANRQFRSSLRHKEAVNWPAVWEKSLMLRGYGVKSGVYKNYDGAIGIKVCFNSINKHYFTYNEKQI